MRLEEENEQLAAAILASEPLHGLFPRTPWQFIQDAILRRKPSHKELGYAAFELHVERVKPLLVSAAQRGDLSDDLCAAINIILAFRRLKEQINAHPEIKGVGALPLPDLLDSATGPVLGEEIWHFVTFRMTGLARRVLKERDIPPPI